MFCKDKGIVKIGQSKLPFEAGTYVVYVVLDRGRGIFQTKQRPREPV